MTVNGSPLDPKRSLKLYIHNPAGFAWGTSGAGAAQLALAILLDATGNPEVAVANCRDFARQFCAGWEDRWELTDAQVREWLSLAETCAE